MTLRRLSSAGLRSECDEAALPQLRRGVAINKPLHSTAIPGQCKQLRAERGREGRERSAALTSPAAPRHADCENPPT